MALKQPASMNECVYFTRRTTGDRGRIMAWARRIDCGKCGKAKMGKPVDGGKVKIRSQEYKCPSCGHTESKEEHDPKLTLEVIYTCPHCGKSGEAKIEYRRKSFEGVPAYVFECSSCSRKIGITKKMKAAKKGREKDNAAEEADDDS